MLGIIDVLGWIQCAIEELTYRKDTNGCLS